MQGGLSSLLPNTLIMQIIDIIILVLVIAGIITGFRKGFIRQLATLTGLVVGLLAAKALYGVVGDKLTGTVTNDPSMAHLFAFILIWIVVPIMFTLVASVITKALEIISLGWLNRILGAALGAVKWVLFISVFICVLNYIDAEGKIVSKELRDQSMLYKPVGELAGLFMPVVQDFANDILQKQRQEQIQPDKKNHGVEPREI